MNPTCTLTNLNTRIRSSTLYANARTPLDSIWSNFRRRPEKSHLQPQVSEKLQNETATFRLCLIFARASPDRAGALLDGVFASALRIRAPSRVSPSRFCGKVV